MRLCPACGAASPTAAHRAAQFLRSGLSPCRARRGRGRLPLRLRSRSRRREAPPSPLPCSRCSPPRQASRRNRIWRRPLASRPDSRRIDDWRRRGAVRGERRAMHPCRRPEAARQDAGCAKRKSARSSSDRHRRTSRTPFREDVSQATCQNVGSARSAPPATS